METVDVIGWIGAACLLAAYWLVSTGRWRGRSFAYQVTNLTGAVLLTVNSGYYGAYPSVGLNLVWIAVAVHTLYALRRPEPE